MKTFDNGVWTSIEAEAMADHEGNENRVYSYLYHQGDQGATDEEIQTAIAMNGNSERPARRRLERDGVIVRTQRWRYTRAKRRAIVFVTVRRPSPGQP